MDEKLKQKWIKALRSGKYKQVTGNLVGAGMWRRGPTMVQVLHT